MFICHGFDHVFTTQRENEICPHCGSKVMLEVEYEQTHTLARGCIICGEQYEFIGNDNKHGICDNCRGTIIKLRAEK
jgi:rRNA maturation endonuclease Nob1